MGLGVADVPPVAHDALMPNVRTTLTIDEHLLRAVKIRAARSGLADSEVIQDVLRRDFGLDLLERPDAMPEGEAMALALEAQGAARNTQR